MSNKLSFLVGILLLTTLFAVGCSGESGATTSPATTTITATTATTTKPATSATATTTKPGGSSASLDDVLKKVAGVASVKYTMTITAPGSPAVDQAIWVKNRKMRSETTVQGQNTIILADTDARTMYSYMPAQKMAFKMTWNASGSKSATEEAQSLTQYNPTILGTETIDGKVCLMVQYTVEGSTVKMWLWQEKGLPVRVEAATPQGQTVIQYKNFEFVDIPDSMFVLPDGVQITEMPTGFGGGMPTLPSKP